MIELEITIEVDGRKFGTSKRVPTAGRFDHNLEEAILLLDREMKAIVLAMEAQK